MLLKHKESCCENKESKTNNCTLCDFKAMQKMQLKRHMRDEHEINTGSTSPPLKRKRRTSIKIDEERMEEDEEKVEDLSLKLDDMEIDKEDELEVESIKETKEMTDSIVKEKEEKTRGDDLEAESLKETKEITDRIVKEKGKKMRDEQSMKERSEMMDRKIKEKDEKMKAKEVLQQNKKLEKERRKKIEEKAKLKVQEIEHKKRKQNVKNQKKKLRKTNSICEEALSSNKVKSLSNIKNVPQNCRHLVNKDDIIYTVPGDGCYGPNSAAAFQAIYGGKRYQFLKPCSVENTFIRKLIDGELTSLQTF